MAKAGHWYILMLSAFPASDVSYLLLCFASGQLKIWIADNDGLASVEELRMHSIESADMDEHEFDEATSIHKELDWNQDGFVTKKEYEKLMVDHVGGALADAKRADPHVFGLEDHMLDDESHLDDYFRDDELGEGGADL
jgi:hypothetical protein